ncbi:probable cytokinin riboside 5'-monophosphate phosphoribohydrolase LOGL2 isoform X2 [Xenia sp. Carnegie-2017]|uniref:probable cytokinin riboside 5'-monophosphate phosphoribohydrolase LOGL2 isoform X2 n=1 Tax=Xenia sp. Carnegie-2017 TaxID=2897299 RepID=UPI001F049120|nr:probable cytokinin riboside 5'-monophosphate phosphoribohydrolase LOGL2 isoform X2 [Xenia sp. Carnegie-2017]
MFVNVDRPELGKALARRNITLVYGGGLQGTMGVIARAVHDGGGNVQGITPRFFHKDPQFIASDMIGDTIVVEDMHTRKKMFCDKVVNRAGNAHSRM